MTKNGLIQVADSSQIWSFYEEVTNYIKENNTVLNLGCGEYFNFERILKQKKSVNITSVDILNLQTLPKYVNKYLHWSLEKPFKLTTQFDVVTFFEVIEHIDKTDILIQNCFDNLKEKGLLIFSFPNLSSVFCRLELLFGYQPHVIEVSNMVAGFGGSLLTTIANTERWAIPSHHIRGFTYRAMKEFIQYYGFKIERTFSTKYKVLSLFPSLSTQVVFVCRKTK